MKDPVNGRRAPGPRVFSFPLWEIVGYVRRGGNSSQQLANHLAVRADRDGPARAVGEAGFRVDARADDRGSTIRSCGRTGRSLGTSPLAFDAPTIRPCANPPPATRTLMTLPQWSRPGIGIGARHARVVHARRPAELAHDDHDRRVEQPAARRGRRPGCRRRVEHGQDVLHPGFEAGMEIPAAEGQGDEPDARLDQPACQRGALAPLMAAVAIAEPAGLRWLRSKASPAPAGPRTIENASWSKRSRPSIKPDASTSRRALSKAGQQPAPASIRRHRRRPAAPGWGPGSPRNSGRRPPTNGL